MKRTVFWNDGMINGKENEIMGARKNVNIVIIGASGKTGQLVVQQALDAGHKVTGIYAYAGEAYCSS